VSGDDLANGIGVYETGEEDEGLLVLNEGVVRRGDERLDGIQDEYNSTLDHIPLIERKLVDILWDKFVFRDSHSAEHGLLPEASSSFDGSKCVYSDQNENSLHRPRNHA